VAERFRILTLTANEPERIFSSLDQAIRISDTFTCNIERRTVID
jgi:hypothetical protein